MITKSGFDLAVGRNTTKEDEDDYGQIAGSVLTLAITGAFVLVGEIAAKLAKAVWEGVSGLVKGGEAPEVGVKGDAPEGAGAGEAAEPKPADTPEAKAEGVEVEGERVVAEEPVGDGEHEVKVTEDGEVLLLRLWQASTRVRRRTARSGKQGSQRSLGYG